MRKEEIEQIVENFIVAYNATGLSGVGLTCGEYGLLIREISHYFNKNFASGNPCERKYLLDSCEKERIIKDLGALDFKELARQR